MSIYQTVTQVVTLNPLTRAVKLVKNEDDKPLFDEVLANFMEEQAVKAFGPNVDNWRKLAQSLETMSKHAREKRFDQLLTDKIESIQDAWELYEQTYNAVSTIFMAFFAPRAMTPEDFVFACSCESIEGTMPRFACPCCKGEKFYNNDCFSPLVTAGDRLRVSFFCEGCGFPLDALIKFQ